MKTTARDGYAGVAIVMPQRVETAVAHMAVSALGAVAMPLSMLPAPGRSQASA
jgi:acyl-coenzyme A synthetase/AMP-(fatty) acid ligase